MEFLTRDSLMVQNFSAISGCPWKLNHERQIPPCGTIWSQVGHQQDGVMLLLSLFRITSPTDSLPLLHSQHWRGVKCRWSLSVSLLSSDSRRMTCWVLYLHLEQAPALPFPAEHTAHPVSPIRSEQFCPLCHTRSHPLLF